MKNLIFKGIPSERFGLQLVKSQLDMLPAQNDEYRVIPGHDGMYHVPRELGNKELRIRFKVKNNSLEEWEAKRRKIVAWLHSGAESVIRDTGNPGHFFAGKVVNIDLPEGDHRVYHFWVTFNIHPFEYSDETTIEPVTSGNVIVDYKDLYETPFKFSVTTTKAVNSFAFSVNDVTITYDGEIPSGTEVTVDSRDLTVRLNGDVKVFELAGYFGFLQPGNNVLSTTLTGTRRLTYMGRSL